MGRRKGISERAKQEAAAICGLYCGICPEFPKECGGCCSDRVIAQCQNCGAGFHDCAKEKGVTRCYECDDFPCVRSEKFSTNAWPHHDVVIENVRRWREIGIDVWLRGQEWDHRCPSCGALIKWTSESCQECGCEIADGKRRKLGKTLRSPIMNS